MQKILRSRWRFAQRLALAVPLAMAATAISMAADAAMAQTPPEPAVKLPDFSAYDCAKVSSAAGLSMRHMGQVIKGAYHEWHAFYGAVENKRRLLCISIDRPNPRQLTATEARDFLTDSANLNAPADTARSAAAPESAELPPNVLPEPLLRAQDTQPTKAAPETEMPELPPRGVVHIPSALDTATKAPKSSAATDQKAPATIGVDDRQGIVDSYKYPWNTVGLLVVTYPNNQSFRCSGVLVSDDTVLTAGHCIHNKNRGGFPISARFSPAIGLIGTNSQPLSLVVSYNTTQAWMEISGNDSYPVTDFQNDIAAIKFTSSRASSTTYMPVMFNNTESPVTSAGYPAVVRGVSLEFLFSMTGAERSAALRQYHVREFSIDASGGNSGGPFFYTDPETGQNLLVGLLSYGEELNDRAGGPWYDSWNAPLISSWLGKTIEQPSATVSGLRVPSVFSSARNDVQSYLRFYNNTQTAGTVDVTLFDGDTGAALGTWRSPSIGAYTSPQFYIKNLENEASITHKPTFYTLAIRPTFAGYFQHVVWQLGPGTLENLTACETGVTSDPYVLMNVHSSLLQSNFPGTIMIQNTGTAPITPSLRVLDARTGIGLGTYIPDPIPANAQRFVQVKDLEAALNFDPKGWGIQYHYVIQAPQPFTGYLQQFSSDATTGKVNDMTAMCAMSP